MRKLLSIILTLALVMGLSVPALAANQVAHVVENGVIYFDPDTGTITGYNRDITAADIPAEINGVAVTSIGEKAFYGCDSLTSVTIPSSVTSIGVRAFYSCESLTSITIPEGVTSINGSAFQDCESLTSITIPSSVTSIGASAFRSCRSLTSVTIPEGVTYIRGETFRGCSLESVTIPSSVKAIGGGAFIGCDFTSITIPEGVTSIGTAAFAGCTSLTSITIPSSVTKIDNTGYYYYPSPMSFGKIEDRGVFEGCTSLTSVTIMEGVESIGEDTFSGCESLTSITIPSSVTNIDEYAFNDCDSLTDVYYGGSEAEWYAFRVERGNNAFLNATIHCNSLVPGQTGLTAYARTQPVSIDGKAVELQAYALKDPTTGYETNYVKLRDVAYALNGTAAQFNVGWDGSVNIITNSPYTPNGTEMSTPFSGDRSCSVSTAVTKVDGAAVQLAAIVLTDDNGGGYTYYKLRDLGKALGFNVDWSAERGIFIKTDKPYSE